MKVTKATKKKAEKVTKERLSLEMLGNPLEIAFGKLWEDYYKISASSRYSKNITLYQLRRKIQNPLRSYPISEWYTLGQMYIFLEGMAALKSEQRGENGI